MAIGQEASSSNFSNSNSTPRTCKHDIFLSFRGEDTGKGFTNHLYHALNMSGFKVFRDVEDLPRGETISQELLQEIEESRCAIVILSENYASSSWSLDELQHILASKNKQGQIVFPIFYNVHPSDVRYERNSFGEALAKLEHKFQEDQPKVRKWRDSLTQVANLSAFYDSNQYRTEAELIENMVEHLWDQLRAELPPVSVSDAPIGIERRVDEIFSMSEIGSDIVWIGICGIGGIGKAHLAYAIYDKIHPQFDSLCCFANVKGVSRRKNPLLHLQNDFLFLWLIIIIITIIILLLLLLWLLLLLLLLLLEEVAVASENSLPSPGLSLMDAGECGSLRTLPHKKSTHLFVSVEQDGQHAEGLRRITTSSMTIRGSEIPSWFTNENHLRLNEKHGAAVTIDIPEGDWLGAELCPVVDGNICWPRWGFGFKASDGKSVSLLRKTREHENDIKSSHLWIVFWKIKEENRDELLRTYSQTRWKFFTDWEQQPPSKLVVEESIKCRWRFICKSDLERLKDGGNTWCSEAEEQEQWSSLSINENSQVIIDRCEAMSQVASSPCLEERDTSEDSRMQFIPHYACHHDFPISTANQANLLHRTTVHLRLVLHQVAVLLLTRNQQSPFVIQLMAHKYLPQGREMMMLVAHLCLMLFLFLTCQALNKQGLRRY